MPMDEPVPIRRYAVGCLLIVVAGLVVALLVRPAIFTFAEPRDDSAVVVGTVSEIDRGPVTRELLLARSYGWDGQRDAGDGRVAVTIVVAPSRFGGYSAVAGASPATAECPLSVGADRLTDCDGRAWTFDGLPLDPTDPPLDRFAARVDAGTVIIDLTQLVDDA
jgi:hypothetical protein